MDWHATDPDDAEGSAYLITQAIYWLWRGVKSYGIEYFHETETLPPIPRHRLTRPQLVILPA